MSYFIAVDDIRGTRLNAHFYNKYYANFKV